MILLLSGTSDGRALGLQLAQEGHDVIASAATPYGGQLLPIHDRISHRVGPMNEEDMVAFCEEKAVTAIYDATHPYAVEVSENAKRAAERLQIPYKRFDRPPVKADVSNCMQYDNHEAAARFLARQEGAVFLTIGSNHLKIYTDWIAIDRIFARVLPTSSVVAKCEALGLRPKNMIAMQGPFTQELNGAMMKMCKARFMVTKESSDVGGTGEKIRAAEENGVIPVLIRRPSE